MINMHQKIRYYYQETDNISRLVDIIQVYTGGINSKSSRDSYRNISKKKPKIARRILKNICLNFLKK